MGNTHCLDSLCSLNILKQPTVIKKSSLRDRSMKIHKEDTKPESFHEEILEEDEILDEEEEFEDKEIDENEDIIKSDLAISNEAKLDYTDFTTIKVLNTDDTGGMICLVRKIDKGEDYIMKTINKKNVDEDSIISKNRDYFQHQEYHPYIPVVHFQFDKDNLKYFVMENLQGGSLANLKQKLTRFSEEVAIFYASEVIVALDYLHDGLDVIYRNLSFKNLLLDDQGHIRLIGFGSSNKGSQAEGLAGPEEYRAPEMIRNEVYGKAVDYWSLGCFIFELLVGISPFCSEDRVHLNKRILNNQITWPYYLTKKSINLISKLLTNDPQERMGPAKFDEIKSHVFFENVDWDSVKIRGSFPPIDPTQFRKQSIRDDDELHYYDNSHTLSRVVEDDSDEFSSIKI